MLPFQGNREKKLFQLKYQTSKFFQFRKLSNLQNRTFRRIICSENDEISKNYQIFKMYKFQEI